MQAAAGDVVWAYSKRRLWWPAQVHLPNKIIEITPGTANLVFLEPPILTCLENDQLEELRSSGHQMQAVARLPTNKIADFFRYFVRYNDPSNSEMVKAVDSAKLLLSCESGVEKIPKKRLVESTTSSDEESFEEEDAEGFDKFFSNFSTAFPTHFKSIQFHQTQVNRVKEEIIKRKSIQY